MLAARSFLKLRVQERVHPNIHTQAQHNESRHTGVSVAPTWLLWGKLKHRHGILSGYVLRSALVALAFIPLSTKIWKISTPPQASVKYIIVVVFLVEMQHQLLGGSEVLQAHRAHKALAHLHVGICHGFLSGRGSARRHVQKPVKSTVALDGSGKHGQLLKRVADN